MRLFDQGRLLAPDAQGQFVAGIADSAVRQEVASLLDAATRSDGFLDRGLTIPDPSLRRRSVGGYDLFESLGRGGCGEVYRAAKPGSASVALKMLRTADASAMAALRREIQALRRLCHPGIVRILDSGVVDGLPWYAMERIEGVSLQERLQRDSKGDDTTVPVPTEADAWWTRSQEGMDIPRASAAKTVPPQEAAPATAGRSGTEEEEMSLREHLSIVWRLCRTLAFLHGEGIVHRDLKPANVLIRHDGSPVIVDFGLVSHFPARQSRERLEVTGLVSGSIHYMAPEQVKGDLVDARADLYALGCILYEMVADRPPFMAGNVTEVLRKHLDETPVSFRALGINCPQSLELLILRLLAKRPRDRPGHALLVAAALSELGCGGAASGDGPAPKSYLYRPNVEGREETLDRIRSRIAMLAVGATSPKGKPIDKGILLLEGESGIGKTRIAMEVARKARGRSRFVLIGECLKEHRGSDLFPFRAILRSIAERSRDLFSSTSWFGGGRGSILAEIQPLLADLPGCRRKASPDNLPPDAARFRLLGALADLLSDMARTAPLLLILDDLHFADGLTLGFLKLLERRERTSRLPIAVLGTFRPDLASSELDSLATAANVATLTLASLTKEEISSMMASMLASDPPQSFVDDLASRSGGNPLFVAEYLRLAVAEEILRCDRNGSWQLAVSGQAAFEKLDLPAEIGAILSGSVAALPGNARRLLEALAVLGPEPPARFLAPMLDLSTDEWLADLRLLIDRRIIEERENGELRFVHAQTREIVYERVTREDRKELHDRAASLISQLDEARRRPLAGQLGDHYHEAGHPDAARASYREAFDYALATFAWGEAERCARACQTLMPSPSPEGVDLRHLLGAEVFQRQLRLTEALAEHSQEFDEAKEIGDARRTALALMARGNVEDKIGRRRQAARLACEALRLAREAGDRRLEGQILLNLSQMEGEQTRVRLQESVAIAASIDSRDIEAAARNGMGILAAIQGDQEEAERQFQSALALAVSKDDQRLRANILLNLGVVYRSRGQLAAASEAYRRALDANTLLGDAFLGASVEMNLGCILLDQGHLAEALKRFEEVRLVHHDAGNERGVAMALGNMGDLFQEEGETERARSALVEAERIFLQSGDAGLAAQTKRHLGDLDFMEGHLKEALTRYEEALTLLRSDPSDSIEGQVYVSLASLHRCCGNLEDARSAADRASQLLRTSERLEYGKALVEEGFLELASGRDASGQLSHLDEMLTILRLVEPSAPLARRRQALLRAATARSNGEPLLHGQCPDDLPGWIRDN